MNRAFVPQVLAPLAMLVVAASCATGGSPTLARLDAPPPRAAFEASRVARGAGLAAIGGCAGCHTPEGGRSFAGGRAIETPFGTIYSTNITPDPRTGIGLWSEAAFARAMREGIDRGGRHLYPAFPYDRFTLASDADIRAIYAYLMTRPPVAARHPENRLAFPFNVRAFIGAWKALYFRPGRFREDPAHDAQWNRGAYLAEGLGHCSSCHTPRNALGAERAERHFQGGEAEGWHAYAIDAHSQSPVAWTDEALAAYLARGWHPQHGVARGPMAPVTRELAKADPRDVAAMARYVVSLMEGAQGRVQERAVAPGRDEGARLYQGACRQCHAGDEALPFAGIVLSKSIGVAGEDPRNLVNVILYGLPAAEGATTPIMPGYAGALSDAQVVMLARYLRARFSGKPAWNDLDATVREARAAGPGIARTPAGGSGTDPASVAEAR